MRFLQICRPIALAIALATSATHLSSCASTFGSKKAPHVALENQGVSPKEPEGVAYNIPVPAEPRGQVRIVPEGKVLLQSSRDPNVGIPALKMTMHVNNVADNKTWTVDLREQAIQLSDRRTLTPTFARMNKPSSDKLKIAPRSKQAVDLFFFIPEDLREPEDIQSYNFSWQINLGNKAFRETTPIKALLGTTKPVYPFEREPASLSSNSYFVEPTWWADPFTPLPPVWRGLKH